MITMTPNPTPMDEREAADVLARLYISAGLFNMLKEPDYTATRSALDRAIALLRRDAPREGASVPEGWALVPRTPTAAIIYAAEQHIARVLPDDDDPDESRYVARGVAVAAWRDMLAAASTQEGG